MPAASSRSRTWRRPRRTWDRGRCGLDTAGGGSRPSQRGTRAGPCVLQVQALNLREHLADARPDEIALFAERGQLAGCAFRFRQTPLHRVELARQPRVLVRRARLFGAEPIDDADEQLDLLFEAIDRLEIDAAYCNLCQFELLSDVPRRARG